MGLVDWLKAGGFGGKAVASLERRAPAIPYPVFQPSTPYGPLVHGPGASELLRGAYGDGYALNSAVAACLTALQRTYAEAPLRVYREQANNQREPITPHPAIELLDSPNPGMTGALLMAYVQYCKAVYGNAYVRKVRAGNAVTGEVAQLWPISPAVCWPIRERGSSNFIDYYRYDPGDGKLEKIPPADMIHFRVGLDDRNHMVGMSPLRQLLREVDTDVQTTAMSDRLVRNNGVPGLVVTVPVEAGDIGAENAAVIKQKLTDTFSGEGQGTTAVLTGGATANAYGFNPQQLDLPALHRLPEARIAAVLGVPAIIAGLGAGLDRATYANFKEAREMFVESTIIPTYAEDDATLTRHLLSEFDDRPGIFIAHDITDMRALQEDENAKYTRLSLATGKKPWLTQNEARTDTGYDKLGPEFDTLDTAPPAPDPATMPADAPTPIKSLSTKVLSPVDFERALRGMGALQVGQLAEVLANYQAGQLRRVKARIEGA